MFNCKNLAWVSSFVKENLGVCCPQLQHRKTHSIIVRREKRKQKNRSNALNLPENWNFLTTHPIPSYASTPHTGFFTPLWSASSALKFELSSLLLVSKSFSSFWKCCLHCGSHLSSLPDSATPRVSGSKCTWIEACQANNFLWNNPDYYSIINFTNKWVISLLSLIFPQEHIYFILSS